MIYNTVTYIIIIIEIIINSKCLYSANTITEITISKYSYNLSLTEIYKIKLCLTCIRKKMLLSFLLIQILFLEFICV